MGRFIRGDNKHKTAGRQDKFLPMRVRPRLLHIPHSLRSRNNGLIQNPAHGHLHPASNRGNPMSDLGRFEYLIPYFRFNIVHERDNRPKEEHNSNIPNIPVLPVHRLVPDLHLIQYLSITTSSI